MTTDSQFLEKPAQMSSEQPEWATVDEDEARENVKPDGVNPGAESTTEPPEGTLPPV